MSSYLCMYLTVSKYEYENVYIKLIINSIDIYLFVYVYIRKL